MYYLKIMYFDKGFVTTPVAPTGTAGNAVLGTKDGD